MDVGEGSEDPRRAKREPTVTICGPFGCFGDRLVNLATNYWPPRT